MIDGRDGDDAIFGDAGDDRIEAATATTRSTAARTPTGSTASEVATSFRAGRAPMCCGPDREITPSRATKAVEHVREVGVHDLPLVREAELLHHAPRGEVVRAACR